MNTKIDYLEIIKQSAKLIWKKKIMAVFGFFIALGSFGGGLSYTDESTEQEEFLQNFIVENFEWVIFLAAAFLVLIIAVIFLRIVGIAALTKFAGGDLYDEKFGFRDFFSIGRAYFLRILAIDVLFFIAVMVLIVTLSMPVIFLVTSSAYVTAGILGFVALLIVIPILVWLAFVKKFSYVFLVVSDTKIRDSIEKAHDVFRKNITPSILFSIGVSLIGLVIIIGVFLSAVPITMILFLPTIGAFFISKTLGYVIIGAGMFVVVVLFLLGQSFFEAFRQISWVLFVKQIIGIKKEDEEKIQEVVLLEQIQKSEHL